MPATIENPDATAIRPFTIPEVPEADLEALRAHHGHRSGRPSTATSPGR
jgi:hypothetical protein